MLKFGNGNSKLKKLAEHFGYNYTQVLSFDLPAGYTCPMANICRTYSDRITGKIIDGENSTVRCYAASVESRYPSTRNAHWYNLEALTGSDNMVRDIQESLPKNTKIVRLHSSGDFYSLEYFNAWLQVAINNPNVTFFGYTKILDYVIIPAPDNFKLIYSYGGLMDNKLTNEPTAYIVISANDTELDTICQDNPIDDFFKIMTGKSFALALHGTQRARIK